jgi:hypothetical protein
MKGVAQIAGWKFLLRLFYGSPLPRVAPAQRRTIALAYLTTNRLTLTLPRLLKQQVPARRLTLG